MTITLQATIIETNQDPPQIRLRVETQGRKVLWDLPVLAITEEWKIGTKVAVTVETGDRSGK